MNNFVLLAAGCGSRLAELTRHTHKSLLPVSGKPVIQYIIDQLLLVKHNDIVVVTGYKSEEMNDFLGNQYGSSVRTLFNDLYQVDTNILSVDMGVDCLREPEDGYTIIETDIVIEPNGWVELLPSLESNTSKWVTAGRYSVNLTGGALKVNEEQRVIEIIYAPEYDNKYQDWKKVLGILRVGAVEVAMDRSLRKQAINDSIAQYYLAPWMNNLSKLPCYALDLGDNRAMSFNNIEIYNKIVEDYSRILN